MNYYRNNLGVTFVTDDASFHSFRDWGLYPQQRPTIAPAKPNLNLVPLPGGNGSLDLSEDLTGYVTYKTRKGSFPYIAVDRKHWDAAVTMAARDIHGKAVRVIKDEEPELYYQGRVYIDSVKTNKEKCIITIAGDFDPYKYERRLTDEDWLWDPFNFDIGVIRDYGNITVSGSKTVTVISSPAGGSPIFVCSAAMTMTYDGTTYNLSAGNNQFSTIELPHSEEEVSFSFSGNGTVSIRFRGGYL